MARVRMPADAQEEEVGDDNQQRGHADNELYGQRRCRREMSLDDAQCRGDGGSGHHGEQRHRQDGSRHSFRHVFLFHKSLCGVQSSSRFRCRPDSPFSQIGRKGTKILMK